MSPWKICYALNPWVETAEFNTISLALKPKAFYLFTKWVDIESACKTAESLFSSCVENLGTGMVPRQSMQAWAISSVGRHSGSCSDSWGGVRCHSPLQLGYPRPASSVYHCTLDRLWLFADRRLRAATPGTPIDLPMVRPENNHLSPQQGREQVPVQSLWSPLHSTRRRTRESLTMIYAPTVPVWRRSCQHFRSPFQKK